MTSQAVCRLPYVIVMDRPTTAETHIGQIATGKYLSFQDTSANSSCQFPDRMSAGPKTSHAGETNSNHFERGKGRRRSSSIYLVLTEAFYGEQAQDGDCSVAFSVASTTLFLLRKGLIVVLKGCDSFGLETNM